MNEQTINITLEGHLQNIYGRSTMIRYVGGVTCGKTNSSQCLCKKVVSLVNDMYKLNKKIKPYLLVKIFVLFNHCIGKNNTKLHDTIKLIMNKQQLDDDCMMFILDNEIFHCYIETIMSIPMQKQIIKDFINLIINYKLSRSCENDSTVKLCEIINKNMVINDDNLLLYCNCKQKSIFNNLNEMLIKYDGTLTNQDIMDAACCNIQYTQPIIITLISKGLSVSLNNIITICDKQDVEQLKFILDVTRMPISKKMYESIICGKQYAYRRNGKNHIDKNMLNSIFEKLELIFTYGYCPTNDDIKFAIMRKIEIQNLERFGIVLNEDIYNECIKNEFFPKYKFDCVTQEMYELQKACYEKDTRTIKMLIKTHNLIPDDICMTFASKSRENTTIKILVDAGGKMTVDCIVARTNIIKMGHYITPLVEMYREANDKIIKDYVDEIEFLKKLLVDNNIEIVKNNNIIEDKLNIDNDTIEKYKQKYKLKRIPTKKIIDMFGITKNNKINFNDLVGLLENKIINDKWVDNNMIKIPLNYNTIFGFDENEVLIPIETIEKHIECVKKLVCKIYMHNYENKN